MERKQSPQDIGRLVRNRNLMVQALDRAAREALLRDKRLGLDTPIWRNGRTEWVPPEQIDALLQQSESSNR